MKKIIIIAISFLFVICFSCKNNEVKKDEIKTVSIDSTLDVEKIEIVSVEEFKSRDLYVKNCKFCHGSYGKGDGIKARINNELCPYNLSKESKSDKLVYYVILNGRNKMPMHKTKLGTDNSHMLVIYIKRFRENDKNE